MNRRPISEAKDADLRNSYTALLRAAQRARELSIQTRVPLVVSEGGVIEYLTPWLDEAPTQGGQLEREQLAADPLDDDQTRPATGTPEVRSSRISGQ